MVVTRVPGETRSWTSPTRWKTRRMAPSPGGRVRKSSRTSPTRTTICSSVHPTGRAPSVTSPRRENTAGRAEGPRALRERLTQSHAATAPRTITARTTQSAGLGEKFTSAYTRGVSAGEPTMSMPTLNCRSPGPRAGEGVTCLLNILRDDCHYSKNGRDRAFRFAVGRWWESARLTSEGAGACTGARSPESGVGARCYAAEMPQSTWTLSSSSGINRLDVQSRTSHQVRPAGLCQIARRRGARDDRPSP